MPDDNTPIAMLTVGQLKAVIGGLLAKAAEPRIVHGIAGLCQIAHCGKTKANEIMKSGIINAAIIRPGRNMAIDADKAMELLRGA